MILCVAPLASISISFHIESITYASILLLLDELNYAVINTTVVQNTLHSKLCIQQHNGNNKMENEERNIYANSF